MSNKLFDIARDKAVIAAGGFFCQGCLVGKPVAARSPDERYCKLCCEFLLKEAELDIGRRGRPSWAPIMPQDATPASPSSVQCGNGGAQVTGDVRELCPPEKRGPKYRELPEEMIRRFASEGMGTKAIASKLMAEHGIETSYKTIQRRLAGQGVLTL